MIRPTTANVTMLRARLVEVASWEVDAAILVERRLMAHGHRALAGLVRHMGGKFFGEPRSHCGGGGVRVGGMGHTTRLGG